VHVGGCLQQAGKHERHVDADAGRVVLVTGELVAEYLAVLPPPRADPAADRQVLDLRPLGVRYLVNSDEIPDVAHFRPLPLVSLETAYFAAAPVQHAADVASGVARVYPEFGETAGQAAFRNGRPVRVIAHLLSLRND